MSAVDSEPVLDVPGAGLPRAELIVARTLFRVARWKRNRQHWEDLFQVERNDILSLVRNADVQTISTRVLVDRIRGLEDSSRFWSVSMVLDHLNIVNTSMLGAIVALVKGTVPEGEVSTADVKPDSGSDKKTIDLFEKTCDRFQRLTERFKDLKTDNRYAHPWFGPLDASGWHALAALHMRLHRRQLEMILAATARESEVSERGNGNGKGLE